MLDEWFLFRLKRLADTEKALLRRNNRGAYLSAKQLGFTDKSMARLSGGPVPFHRRAVYR